MKKAKGRKNLKGQAKGTRSKGTRSKGQAKGTRSKS